LQLLGVLLQCSTFHCRYEGLLHDCNAMRASYLFQQDKHYDVSHDTGDKVSLERQKEFWELVIFNVNFIKFCVS
jgi:hypothetical protein